MLNSMNRKNLDYRKKILWRRIKMDKLQYIRENEQLNILLMNECDIYFYKETGDTQFLENN